MSYTIETIQLGPNHRLRVEQDDSPQCPRGDWSMLTGVVNIDGYGNGNYVDVPEVHQPHIPIAEAHDRLYGLGSCMLVRSYVSRETSVLRWARIFHGVALQYDATYGAYWFCNSEGEDGFNENWPDLVPGTPEHFAKQNEVIDQERETYRQWAEGEVYGVIHEKLETWVKADDPDETRDDWEEVDALWGCYLDDDYTALVVAKEHFDLDGATLPE